MRKIIVKTIIIFCSCVVAVPAIAQLNGLKLHSKYTYLYKRYRINEISQYEHTVFQKRKIIKFRVDSIILLQGRNRKLFILSKCINSMMFNTTVRVEEKKKSKFNVFDFDPEYLTDGVEDQSYQQSTILYQNDSLIYTITVPKLFFIKYLHERNYIKKLDSTLTKMYDASEPDAINNQFIDFEEYYFPIYPFLSFKIENDRNCNFYLRKKIYFTPKDKKIEKKEFNRIIKSRIIGNIQLLESIIEDAVSSATTKHYRYENIIRLIKID